MFAYSELSQVKAVFREILGGVIPHPFKTPVYILGSYFGPLYEISQGLGKQKKK